MREWNVVSADSHIETSPMAWTQRLPNEFKDDGPRIVALPDGSGDGWTVGDLAPVAFGLTSTAGQKYREFSATRRRVEGAPGTGSAEQRLLEQDEDGVDAELLFASPFTVMLKAIKRPEAQVAACVAFNDWLAEFCDVDSDRLLGVALIPTTSVRDATAELERVATKPSLRGALLLKFPSGAEKLTPEDDLFWRAAEETGVCVMGHHNFGGRPTGADGSEIDYTTDIGVEDAAVRKMAYLLNADTVGPSNPLYTVLQIFAGGVCDRFPKIRFHFAETGIGWLGYWLEQMEDRYDRNRFWLNVNFERRPAEYVRDHFTFSFQEDRAGVLLRELIGVNNICWANDFPHSVSDWPWSIETRARQFAGVPADHRRRMEGLNILTQVGMITPADRERMAAAPTPSDPELVAARGARRM